MTFSRAHTSGKAADDAKLLLLNNTDPPVRSIVRAPLKHNCTTLSLYRNLTPNLTWSGLPPKSNGVFYGPCATFHQI